MEYFHSPLLVFMAGRYTFCIFCDQVNMSGTVFRSGGDVFFPRRFFSAFFIKGEKFFDPL